MNSKWMVFSQCILYAVFIYTSKLYHWSSDILAVVICFLAGVFAYKAAEKNQDYKVLWKLASAMAILYGVLEGIWSFLYFFTSIKPESSLALETAYYVPYFIMSYSVIGYFVRNRVKTDKTRLLVEVVFMMLIVSVLWKGVFWSKLYLYTYSSEIFLLIVFTLLINSIFFISILVLGASIRNIKQFMAFPILIFPYLVYAMTDGFYLYEYVTSSYYKNDLSDLMYILSYSILGIVACISISYAEQHKKDNSPKKEVEVRTLAMLWLVPVPVIFYACGMLNANHFLLILSIIIAYEFYQYFIQQSDVSAMLLKKEHAMNIELERIVEERTAELILMNERLQIEAVTDALTGLKNRKYFYKCLQEKIDDASSDFAVLFIDLDEFKAINDTHGHQMGDDVLIHVSSGLEKIIGDNGIVARLGGDEFGIVIDATETVVVETYIASIKASINRPINREYYSIQAKASIGMSRYPRDGHSLDTLLKLADSAMYKEKQIRGN